MSSTSTAAFHVSNGQIIGPNGQPFKAQGIDVLDATLGTIVSDPSGGALLQNFPNTNMVRIMLSSYTPDQSVLNTIDWLTAKGIVVQLCNYVNWNSGVPTGATLTQETNFFSQMATTYKSNPYVWFNTMNEPQDTYDGLPAGAIDAEHVAVYNAIRATGNTNMIGLDADGAIQTYDLNPSTCLSMSNVFWDDHYYNWLANMSTDLPTNENALAGEIANVQTMQSADGVMPTIIGEFGNATDGSNIDPGGTQAVQAVLDVSQQFSGWTAFTYLWPASWGGVVGAADQLTNEYTGAMTP